MKINFFKIFIILIIFFVMGVFFKSLNKVTVYDTKNLVGKKISKVELKNFKDEIFLTEVDLAKNKFTLINFWASWCSPCRKEHPFLLKLNKEKNIKLLGINFKDNKNNAVSFLKELGDPYNYLARDELGKQSINFGVYGIPESILINEDLIVLEKFIGPLSNTDYELIREKIK
ncbi:MAG: DsbE family thiol:disulfide interchange protein [Pelagibacteraceae bacterium]|nr:DsbE family thiol:disulfide interchange protein [Pelagibacteraceae bacterium]|tara:strand:- start:1098 stop:1616 length:519 start_codon:yes stop_codon:yes gene_type:complete